MKVLVKSAWGSDDLTKAPFPFLHANALWPKQDTWSRSSRWAEGSL
jgi:hypothetical protein